MSESADQRCAIEHRRQLLDGLSGRAVEIGARQGRNFQHYPAKSHDGPCNCLSWWRAASQFYK